eukprot:scaffold227371_cov17-Tisochrysis_lutea.AAC.1
MSIKFKVWQLLKGILSGSQPPLPPFSFWPPCTVDDKEGQSISGVSRGSQRGCKGAPISPFFSEGLQFKVCQQVERSSMIQPCFEVSPTIQHCRQKSWSAGQLVQVKIKPFPRLLGCKPAAGHQLLTWQASHHLDWKRFVYESNPFYHSMHRWSLAKGGLHKLKVSVWGETVQVATCGQELFCNSRSIHTECITFGRHSNRRERGVAGGSRGVNFLGPPLHNFSEPAFSELRIYHQIPGLKPCQLALVWCKVEGGSACMTRSQCNMGMGVGRRVRVGEGAANQTKFPGQGQCKMDGQLKKEQIDILIVRVGALPRKGVVGVV